MATEKNAEARPADELDADSSLHTEAMERYDAAWQREERNITEGYEDLQFLAGEGQWDEQVKAERTAAGRPCLTINRLPQFIRQITGDQRQMRPSIKVMPVDDRGDPDTAEKLAGMIRYIENRSNANAVYARGGDGQVQAGMGHWRVESEYAADTTYEQELRISPIEDGLAVLWDPDSILPGKVDAQWLFVNYDVSEGGFKKRWPDASLDDMGHQTHRYFNGWYGEGFVRIAEYWFKKPIKRKLLIADAFIDDITDDPEGLSRAEALVKASAAIGLPAKIEERDGFQIFRAIISGSEVLEQPKKWPGRYFPIVPVPGEEIRLGRTVMRHGAIRFARDPQRMYNYFASAEAEVVALQPKAPFLVTEKNVENHADEWDNANNENLPYLTYTPDPENGGRSPERSTPPVASSGIREGRMQAAEDLQATTGIYNSSLGAESNETSGKAIMARQREGDTGTYVYVQNLSDAIGHTGRIIVDLIPHIYDTNRVVRICGEDGSEELVEVNKPKGLQLQAGLGAEQPVTDIDPETGEPVAGGIAGDINLDDLGGIENDVTIGAYDVVMVMGPSFNTRREEARDGMQAFLQGAGDAAAGFIDLVADAQDWPNKEAVRDRAKLMLPPPIQEALAAKEKEGKPPSPEEQQRMAAQKAVEQAQLKAAVDSAEAERINAEAALLSAKAALLTAAVGTTLPPGGQPGEAPGAPGEAPAEGEPMPGMEPGAGVPDDAPGVHLDAITQQLAQQGQMISQIGQLLQQLMQGGPPPAPPQ